MQTTYEKSFSYNNLTKVNHDLKLDWCFKTKERKVTQPSRLCSNNPNANKNYWQLNLIWTSFLR